MPTIVPLSAIDPHLVEELLDTAFEPARRGRTAYRIREGAKWLEGLSLAALDDDEFLVATIQVWPVALACPDGAAHPLLMVGPVAVMPAHQGEGYGKALMAASLGAIEALAGDTAPPLPQVLIGDAPYYSRFGFAEAPRGWRCPGPWDPARLLVRGAAPALLPQGGMLGPWRGGAAAGSIAGGLAN
ncbi:GNAT family N-acetyltransferase [Altererythrobacter aerius]|uniref:GNAT family N-acetyltransferase n=1 Tax=Tsuneonella aeria TaxID=1837929 RepID=A0A6I4TEA9_9SPHN|nr:N-acetyltransferase [Tsuneonella aeria]MXO74505.1 GNAT family N-acetyltransferase [Tsuneonella aeria]